MRRLTFAMSLVLTACLDFGRMRVRTAEQIPRVTATDPADSVGDVSPAAILAVSFSHVMDAESFELSIIPDIDVQLVEWDEPTKTAIFLPLTNLTPSTEYHVSITGRTVERIPLEHAAQFSFTTGAAAPTTPSLITSTPIANATNVAFESPLVLLFDRPMSREAFSAQVDPSLTLPPPVWNLARTQATFSPITWQNSTSYTVTLSGADFGGQRLPSPTTLAFTVAKPPDAEGPIPLFHTPSPSGNPINLNQITVTFDEPLLASSVVGSLSIAGQSAPSCATLAVMGAQLVCTLPVGNNFVLNQTYQVTVATTLKDSAGNALAAPYTFSFTTNQAADNAPPVLEAWGITFATNADPGGANPWANPPTIWPVGVALDSQLTLIFSKAITIDVDDFVWHRVNDGLDIKLIATADPDPRIVHLAHVDANNQPEALAPNTTISFSVKPTLTDTAGNAVASTKPLTGKFRTILRSFDVAINAMPELDGWARSDDTADSDNDDILVGRVGGVPPNKYYMGFVSFSLSGLTDQVTDVISASVQMCQHQLNGAPYAMGPVTIEPVRFLTIDSSLLSKAAECSGACKTTLSSTTTLGLHVGQITEAVRYQFAHDDPFAQFRLDHQPHKSGSVEATSLWYSADAPAGTCPGSGESRRPELHLDFEWKGDPLP